jgi:hypothetical protein
LAVFLFNEPLSTHKLVALGFIWTAIAIYLVDTLRWLAQERTRSQRPTLTEAERLEPAPADV